jgi:hypothetical protein
MGDRIKNVKTNEMKKKIGSGKTRTEIKRTN